MTLIYFEMLQTMVWLKFYYSKQKKNIAAYIFQGLFNIEHPYI